MSVKTEYCEIKEGECNNYYSCQYMKHRFSTIECSKDKKNVETIHQGELEQRKKILEG